MHTAIVFLPLIGSIIAGLLGRIIGGRERRDLFHGRGLDLFDIRYDARRRDARELDLRRRDRRRFQCRGLNFRHLDRRRIELRHVQGERFELRRCLEHA